MIKLKKTIKNPIKKKRHFVTLLEVLIALGLLITLTSFLFGFYSTIDNMHTDLDKSRKENFRLLYLQNRLRAALSMSTPEEARGSAKKKTFFFTSKDENAFLKENSLIFLYDNLYDIRPWFSNAVLGRLYLDRDGALCLATWPNPQQWLDGGNSLEKSPMKKEVLLQDVRELSFKFFVPPHQEKSVKPKAVSEGQEKIDPETNKWHDEWLQAYQELPALVKVTIVRETSSKKKETESIVFVFPIARYDKAIIYHKDDL